MSNASSRAAHRGSVALEGVEVIKSFKMCGVFTVSVIGGLELSQSWRSTYLCVCV